MSLCVLRFFGSIYCAHILRFHLLIIRKHGACSSLGAWLTGRWRYRLCPGCVQAVSYDCFIKFKRWFLLPCASFHRHRFSVDPCFLHEHFSIVSKYRKKLTTIGDLDFYYNWHKIFYRFVTLARPWYQLQVFGCIGKTFKLSRGWLNVLLILMLLQTISLCSCKHNVESMLRLCGYYYSSQE